MQDLLRQWPLLAVVFFSMVEISESLLVLKRVLIKMKRGHMATIFTGLLIFYQVYCVLTRFQRIAATIDRSLRATRLAFRFFCLEYFLKSIAVLSFMAMTIVDPEFDKENMEKSKAAVEKMSILTMLMFYTPIFIGWGLKRTLDELRKEKREALERLQPQQQQQQQQPSPANVGETNAATMAEEERRQLLRVRAWPRYLIIGVSGSVVITGLLWFATFPAGSSKWDFFITTYGLLVYSFMFLASYRKSLSGSRITVNIILLEVIFNAVVSAWQTYKESESAPPSLPDFFGLITLIMSDLMFVWVTKQAVKDLEDRDARVDAYNTRIIAAIAEKARLEAAHEESSRNSSSTQY